MEDTLELLYLLLIGHAKERKREIVADVVDADNGIASYVTTGTDFPQSGEYTIQPLYNDNENGTDIAAIKKTLLVGKRL